MIQKTKWPKSSRSLTHLQKEDTLKTFEIASNSALTKLKKIISANIIRRLKKSGQFQQPR